ncbi:MAG TPA: hypothetical protein VGM69_03255 [Chloroflexota bacterium]|jgi:hypothetical protein
MTTRPDTPEVLDAFVEALQRGTDPAAVLDPAAAGAARDLHALAAASGPRPGFLEALESRLLATPVGAPVPLRRRIRRLLLAPLAALLVLAVGLAAASAASPVVRAQVERLACFVPGLGIRPCDVPGLIARQPTSVARGGTILTVTHLLSAGGETNVRIEITGLPAPPGGAGRDTRVRLRDPGGREYAARTGTHESGAVREGETGGSTTFSADWTFEALDRSVRAADVLLEAPEPVGSWQVRVPLAPTADTGLTAAGEGGQSVTIGGVTLRVTGVAADAERTALEVVGSAAAPARAGTASDRVTSITPPCWPGRRRSKMTHPRFEMAGRLGYFQAELEHARQTITALEAPKEPIAATPAGPVFAPLPAEPEPPRRPWWRFWA